METAKKKYNKNPEAERYNIWNQKDISLTAYWTQQKKLVVNLKTG